ncbi:MAG: IS630 family transposase [Actinomycetota bacterium]|nr:IS630 family transposase [Actinomycetota bacterium]
MDRDARSLPQAAQEELRRRAVALVGEGRTQVEVSGLLGVTRQAVGNWMRAHRSGGDRALSVRRRGRRGGHTKLSEARQRRIAELVSGKNPDQLSLPGFLWTRALVRDLIANELGVELGEDTVGRYLRAWGFSPQKPMRRAYEQSDEAVRRWLEKRYPAIERQARKDRAEILWADEMGLRSDHSTGRSWAPVGRTPVTQGTGKRFKTNMIAAVSNTGTLRFRVFDERFTAPVFLDFLKRLIKDGKGRKVVLIVDGHPAHRARMVRDFIAANPQLIELHFLPGYSPELNPAEMLNCDVKANAVGRRRPLDLAQLKAAVRRYLRARQRRRWQVAKYFLERHVTYAAATTI